MTDDMGQSPFQDFVIRIERADEGYRVEVQCAAGEAEAPFHLPFDDKDLKIFLLETSRSRKPANRGRIPEPMQKTKDFGGRLFDAVINGAVRDVFTLARHDAERGGYGLRIQLRLGSAPELANLPWEFMFDGRDFVALTSATPLVRYLDLPNTPRPMTVTLPLRILVTISSPINLEPLDLEAERQRVEDALGPLRERGTVEIEYTDEPSLSALQRALRKAKSAGRPFHVWHYLGHGAYDPNAQASVLMFCDESGVAAPVDGFQLGTMFASYPDTRLALLNACEGARSEGEDPFAGVATALVERGIPAVIGMQFEITDQAAITFAGAFYSAVVDGLPVDSALVDARLAVFFLPNWVEWATPVLFMRVHDGRLFDVQESANMIEESGTQFEVKPLAAFKVIPTLTGLEGPLAGKVIELEGKITTLGRSPDNTIPLADSKVSRQHAQIEARGKELWLSDLGSTNGTKLFDRAISEPTRLKDGAKFRVGDSLFEVTIEGATKAEVPPAAPQPAMGMGPGAVAFPYGQINQPAVPGRFYEIASFSAPQLAERIQQWFFMQQYDAQIIPQGLMIAVQGRKEGMVRSLLGMAYAATVIIEPTPTGFKASVGGGKWIDKAAVAAVGMFVAFGFTVFTAGYGATQQKQLENNLWLMIDQFVMASGGRRVA